MGVLNLSVVGNGNFTQEGTLYGLLVREEEDQNGARDIRLVWSTEEGSGTQKEWVVNLSARGYQKGMPYQTEWRSFSETLPASACNEAKPYGDGGRVWWSHNLNIGGALTWLLGSGAAWRYSTRLFDSIEFQVDVHSNFTQSYIDQFGLPGSDTARLSFSIGYCPVYNLTAASYTSDGQLLINYSTSWTRMDDRYSLEGEASRPGGMCTVGGRPLLYDLVYGTVLSSGATGTILVDGSDLTEIVAGKEIYLNIWMNAVYRPITMEFARMSGYVTVKDLRSCSTPHLTVKQAGETIVIGTSSLHDKEVEPETVVVKMVGSAYSADQVSVATGADATFRFAPLGTTVEFEAIGFTSSGGVSSVSNRVSVNTGQLSKSILLDPVAGGDRVALRLRMEWDSMGPTVDVQPNMTTVLLNDRSAKSAYYGKGASKSVSFASALLDDAGMAVEMLPTLGDLMCRFPDGRRYCIAPQVKVDRKTSTIVLVTISGDEVGG